MRRRQIIGFLLILLLAAGLRFWALGFGLPNASRPDEENISYAALHFILAKAMAGSGALNPHFFEYPSFFLYVIAALYGLWFWLGTSCGLFSNFAQFHHLYAENVTLFHLVSRGVSAFLGTCTVPLVFLLAWRLAPEAPRFPWIAACLMAITYLHMRDSHFGVTDVPMTFWVTLSLLFSVKLFQMESFRKPLVWASVFAGLAASTKYPGGLALAPIAVALFLKARMNPTFNMKRWFLLAMVCMLAAFLGTSPYVLLDFPSFWHDLSFQLYHLSQGHHPTGQGLGWGHHLTFTLFYGLGFLYELLAVGGLFWILLKGQRRVWWIPASFALLLYIGMGAGKTVFVRYMVPLLPVLALSAAWAVTRLAQQLEVRFPLPVRDVWIGLLTLLVGGQSLWYALSLDALLSQLDTRALASQWIQRHNPPSVPVAAGIWPGSVALPWAYPKLVVRPEAYAPAKPQGPFYLHPIPWLNMALIPTLESPGLLKQLGVVYVVANSHPILPAYSIAPGTLTVLEQQGRAVATFNPGGQDGCRYDLDDAFFVPFVPCSAIIRPGPVITIFQLF